MRISIERISPSQETKLQQALDLNQVIFAEALQDQPASSSSSSSSSSATYSSKDTWTHRLIHCEGHLYLAEVDDHPVGFMFLYRKHWPAPLNTDHQRERDESWHIWLCGVMPECQGTRCMWDLFHHAVTNLTAQGEPTLFTVNTYAAKFPRMVGWLGKNGWTVSDTDTATGRSTWIREFTS